VAGAAAGIDGAGGGGGANGDTVTRGETIRRWPGWRREMQRREDLAWSGSERRRGSSASKTSISA
jgi:hypothetical protein